MFCTGSALFANVPVQVLQITLFIWHSDVTVTSIARYVQTRSLISLVNDNHVGNDLKKSLMFVYFGSIVNIRPKTNVWVNIESKRIRAMRYGMGSSGRDENMHYSAINWTWSGPRNSRTYKCRCRLSTSAKKHFGGVNYTFRRGTPFHKMSTPRKRKQIPSILNWTQYFGRGLVRRIAKLEVTTLLPLIKMEYILSVQWIKPP